MLSIFPCYSADDKPFASDLAGFLDRGAGIPVFLEDGEIGPGETLLSKAADGLQAAVVLLILSPNSAPSRWVRREWEPVLLDRPREAGVKLATILCGDCEFPALLRRENFFDLTRDRLSGLREIKRWLFGLEPRAGEAQFIPARQTGFSGRDSELEALRRALADEPGVAVIASAAPDAVKTALALEFARQSKRDFEGICWLSCGGRSLASLAGDLASQLGMRLEGDEASNASELRRLCAQRRLLIVLDDVCDAAVAGLAMEMKSRSSILVTAYREDLCPRIGGIAIALQSEEGDCKLPRTMESLGEHHRRLLAAMSACGSGLFRIELATEIAGLQAGTAGGVLRELRSYGLAMEVDRRYSRYMLPPLAREMAPPPDETLRAHAQVVCRGFAGWARQGGECEGDLPQLLLAVNRLAHGDEDGEAWRLSCELANRGVALLLQKGRQAEAFELLEGISSGAEIREDRRRLEDCSRRQVWILESWDRFKEARALSERRSVLYRDQMSFEF